MEKFLFTTLLAILAFAATPASAQFGNLKKMVKDKAKTGEPKTNQTNKERLQIDRAGKFSHLPDASEKPAFLRASDVVASHSIVAFKVGADNNTAIGYIKLK